MQIVYSTWAKPKENYGYAHKAQLSTGGAVGKALGGSPQCSKVALCAASVILTSVFNIKATEHRFWHLIDVNIVDRLILFVELAKNGKNAKLN